MTNRQIHRCIQREFIAGIFPRTEDLERHENEHIAECTQESCTAEANRIKIFKLRSILKKLDLDHEE